MKLTIEQALQNGIAAHKEGKLQDAEGFYRAILKIQPKHPDANHNLGVLAVSMNKLSEALTFFQTAVEANSKIEQFWLSYIDVLIKDKQYESATKVLEQVKKHGFVYEKFIILENRLASISNKKTISNLSPSQKQINNLLEGYQNGRFADVEKKAIVITKKFPEHQFAWKILGVIFLKAGRLSEALNVNQKSIALSPNDAEAHNNLGITFKELGRLEEAEASCLQAITLNPNLIQAHSSLGNTLKEQGRLLDAVASYSQAIALNPNLAEVHSNLGDTLKELDRLEEAEASLLEAIALNPNLAEAHSNLGDTLKELGRLQEAEVSFIKAIELNPNLAEAHNNLGITLKELGRLKEAEVSCLKAIELNPYLAEAHFSLGVTLKELDRLNEAELSLIEAVKLKPNMLSANDNLGHLLQALGKFEDAEVFYKKCISLAPSNRHLTKSMALRLYDQGKFKKALSLFDSYNTKTSRALALRCLYALGNIKDIYKRIEDTVELDDMNLRIAAFASFIAETQKKDTANRFCRNPLDFLHISNLSSKIENSNTFITNLIEELNNVVTIWEPPNQSGNGGFKSIGNLFDYPKPNIATLKDIILKEIDAYHEKFKNKKCTFIEKWPVEKNMSGWHIILKENGYQNSHFHPDGWLSGVIYLKVVPPLKDNEGAIKFDMALPDYPDSDLPKKVHTPQVGDIVLFPSSLYHGTIPFSTDTDRIIVSFDLKPDFHNAKRY